MSAHAWIAINDHLSLLTVRENYLPAGRLTELPSLIHIIVNLEFYRQAA